METGSMDGGDLVVPGVAEFCDRARRSSGKCTGACASFGDGNRRSERLAIEDPEDLCELSISICAICWE